MTIIDGAFTKTCYRCKRSLSLSAYRETTSGKSLKRQCKYCDDEVARLRREADPELAERVRRQKRESRMRSYYKNPDADKTYLRAQRRAARWVRRTHPDVWQVILDSERTK